MHWTELTTSCVTRFVAFMMLEWINERMEWLNRHNFWWRLPLLRHCSNRQTQFSNKLNTEGVPSACSQLNTFSITENNYTEHCLSAHSFWSLKHNRHDWRSSNFTTMSWIAGNESCQTSKCFDGGWIMNGSLHIRLKSPWNHIQHINGVNLEAWEDVYHK
jgi:hypothetical protein